MQNGCPNRAEKAPPQATLSGRKPSGQGPLPSRSTWTRGGATSSKGSVVRASANPSPHPIPSPQTVTESPKQPKVTATSTTTRTKKP